MRFFLPSSYLTQRFGIFLIKGIDEELTIGDDETIEKSFQERNLKLKFCRIDGTFMVAIQK